MVDRLSVHDGSRARSVIADHAADRGPIGRCGIRSQVQSMLGKLRVQPVANDAGLHASPAFVDIHFQHLIHVLRYVDDHTRAERLARKRRSATARRNWHAELPGYLDRLDAILLVARHDNARGHHLVVARVGRVQSATHLVEVHLAAHGRSKGLFEFRDVNGALGLVEGHYVDFGW